jgi:undecaprenyl-diphosphatase
MLTDIITYNLMQATENPTTTAAAKILSYIFDPIVLIAATLAISIYLFLKHKRKQSIVLILMVAITAIIIKASKEILQVTRPPNPIIAKTSFSFPSGHVTMSIVFLGLITHMITKNKSDRTKITVALTTGLIIIAIIFSRIYLRVHWLSDTLAGFALGTIILILGIQLYDKTITSPKSDKSHIHSLPQSQNQPQPRRPSSKP